MHEMEFRPPYLVVLLFVVLAGTLRVGIAQAPLPEKIAQPLYAGDRYFKSGQFASALTEWDRALQAAAGNTQLLLQSDVLVRKAGAFRALGHVERAIAALRQAAVLAVGDEPRRARILVNYGSALQAAGLLNEAREQLDAARELAQKLGNEDLEAAALNNLGLVLAGLDQHEQANSLHQESAKLAAATGNRLLESQALVNAAYASERTGNSERAAAVAQTANQAARNLPESHDAAYVLISLGQLNLRLHRTTPSQAQLDASLSSLNAGMRMAVVMGDRRSLSYALGYLGEVYENEGHLEGALDLTRRATLAAEGLNAAELDYRWSWQTARLLRSQGDAEGAIAAYRRAVQQLQSIRPDLTTSVGSGRSSFREILAPVYFELADLLLQQSAQTDSPSRIQQLLVEARDTIERSKTAELQDYFRDSCVATLQSSITEVAKVGARTAIIYPILLRERLELLVTFPDGIKQYRVPVNSKTLVETIRDFRFQVERRTTRSYLPLAQQLYLWLIKPIEAELSAQKTDTLVFVPEGALRTIPLSALHDGQEFLINKFAVATTPGLTLTDPRPLDARSSQVLLTGLTEPVQGFSSLPYVGEELDLVQQILGGKLLKDSEFVVSNIEREFSQKPFTVVHIASHGQFRSDPKQTFLLTHDGKLTMDQLEKMIAPSRYRDQPLELLTLSACQTAAGDDRAALGLAGVAVKAGARSALASLWFINDESSALLVSDFYRNLTQPAASKAKALQRAQIKMISDNRFGHPAYWAPFLLIGNWL